MTLSFSTSPQSALNSASPPAREVVHQHLAYRQGHAPAHRDVQELVGTVGVGMPAEDAGDDELRLFAGDRGFR